jgi:hypothetical protein
MIRTYCLVAILCAPLGLAACGASSSGPKGSSGAAEASSGAPSATGGADASSGASAAPAEGAAESKPVVKKSKIEQCTDVGNSMQLGQKIGPIANVNDGPKLRQMVGELRRGADELGKVGVGLPDLERVRGNYVETMRGMADALEAAADAKGSGEQKSALERFRKLEPKLNELIGDLNTVCNSR